MTPEPGEGVISTIEFPTGQTVHAISKAIYQLLEEGWKFKYLNLTHISLTRTWESLEETTLEKKE